VTPSEALDRVVHYLDRAHETGFKAKAFQRAAEVVRSLPPEEIEERAKNNTLKQLDGIGDSSAKVIVEALRGDTKYLEKMDRETRITVTPDGQRFREALKGDCHLHSRWSDGGATIEAMANTARDLGHEYMVLTDHSPRLTVAHGLDRDRLLRQLEDIKVLNQQLAPFRILTGMEVDILEDGALDLDDDLLAELDIVVASVHSKLRQERIGMTARMLRAVESPHVDILGHCTGRLIGKRPESEFDADRVFKACAANNTAVEFNCRPERLDPPEPLIAKAIAAGCWFSIDSDAHATGQLEWQPLGCDRAAKTGVELERVINTMSADDLLAWSAA
jgi:putative hydrolase